MISSIYQIFWLDVFSYGHDMYWAIMNVLVPGFFISTILNFLFVDIYIRRPMVSAASLVSAGLPIGISSENADSYYRCTGIAKLAFALVFAAQVISKICILDVRSKSSSTSNIIIIVEWLLGAYMVAGIAWVIKTCPPWEAFC